MEKIWISCIIIIIILFQSSKGSKDSETETLSVLVLKKHYVKLQSAWFFAIYSVKFCMMYQYLIYG